VVSGVRWRQLGLFDQYRGSYLVSRLGSKLESEYESTGPTYSSPPIQFFDCCYPFSAKNGVEKYFCEIGASRPKLPQTG
jgi:hypothetical protein